LPIAKPDTGATEENNMNSERILEVLNLLVTNYDQRRHPLFVDEGRTIQQALTANLRQESDLFKKMVRCLGYAQHTTMVDAAKSVKQSFAKVEEDLQVFLERSARLRLVCLICRHDYLLQAFMVKYSFDLNAWPDLSPMLLEAMGFSSGDDDHTTEHIHMLETLLGQSGMEKFYDLKKLVRSLAGEKNIQAEEISKLQAELKRKTADFETRADEILTESGNLRKQLEEMRKGA